MVGLFIFIAAALVCSLSEWLHARRVRRVARLAFGQDERPRRWVHAAMPLRVAAVAATAWGLWTLWSLGAAASADSMEDEKMRRHLVIALDVSPSMHLADAGPAGGHTRGDRAREVLRSILARVDSRRMRVSIIAFYTTARPVVIDTFDPDVVANVLADLPLEHVFTGGKTNLYAGVKAAAELGKPWREGSATLVVASDGDTLPAEAIPTLPPAFAETLVLGVGSPNHGTFIDGHTSRQDAGALERLALRLGGRYQDVNARHLPSGQIAALAASARQSDTKQIDWRRIALVSVAAGSLALALLPVLLSLFGTAYRAGNPRGGANERSEAARTGRATATRDRSALVGASSSYQESDHA